MNEANELVCHVAVLPSTAEGTAAAEIAYSPFKFYKTFTAEQVLLHVAHKVCSVSWLTLLPRRVHAAERRQERGGAVCDCV